MTRQRVILLAALVVVLCVVAGMAWAHLAAARRTAFAALVDLGDSTQCAERIEAFRHRPTLASDHQRLDFEIAGLVERAAKAAGVDTRQVIRRTGEPPQRLLDTAYKEKPTQILLRDVSLQQLVTLLHGVLGGENGLQARNLHLSAPSAEDAGNQWSAELTLTYLIYDPQRTEK